MKKLLIFLLAASLCTACKDNKAAAKTDDKNAATKDKDDYRNRDNDDKKNSDDQKSNDNGSNRDNGNKDNGNSSNSDDRNSDNNSRDNNDSRNSGSSDEKGWTSNYVREFVDNCITEAEKGMSSKKAYSYCTCMQEKIEKMYPNAQDASAITAEDMKTPSMMRMIKDCLAGY